MDCLICSKQVASREEVFFFVKGPKDVHLTIKPELQAIVNAKNVFSTFRENKKKVRVKCSACNSNLGCELPFGPNGTKFFAFAGDKVKLCSRRLANKQTWWSMYREFQLEERDIHSFFNVLTQVARSEPVETPVADLQPPIFPSVLNLYDFEWDSVSLMRKPREYQIKAYIEALQNHMIVVIRTGAGKTLIASMLLARMCSLNPDKMGVMIVDRIPLVFQQRDAIQADTNLSVLGICGENRTEYKMKQINDGRYAVLVVTAGAFFEMVTRKAVTVDMFCVIVFDECHHLSGGHKYVEVLGLFTKQRLANQPRFLGLTASPVSGNTFTQIDNRLTKYLTNLPPSTKIFFPDLPRLDHDTQIISVSLSLEQKNFMQCSTRKLNDLLLRVCSFVGVETLKMRDDLLNSYQLVGDIRSLKSEYLSNDYLQNMLKEAYILINCLTVCEILGVPMSYDTLTDKLGADGFEQFQEVQLVSQRLQTLDAVLEKALQASKILVFCSTREIARKLFPYLNEKYPQFNAQFVFGHGGYDGMDWEGEQEDVLKEFRSGNCKLIIATTVLEEGLDVTTCDYVICFTGVKSVIQFIQCRGRARKKNAKFIVFQSEAEKNRKKDVQAEEELLKLVMRQKQNRHQYFSELSKGIMEKIRQELPMENGEDNELVFALDTSKKRKNDFTFTLYVDALVDVNPNRFKAKLVELLNDLGGFRVKRLELRGDGGNDLASVLKNNTLVFLVGVSCPSTDLSAEAAYTLFCRVFSFQVDFENQKSNVWSRKPKRSRALNTQVLLHSIAYGVGSFEDRITANIAHQFDIDVTVAFIPKKYIILLFAGNKVVIPLTALGRFAIISMNTAQDFWLALVLNYPPMVYFFDDVDLEFVRRFNPNDILQPFVTNPVLFLKFPTQQLLPLRDVLNTPSHFPSPVFDVHLKFYDINNNRPVNLNTKTMGGLRNVFWMLKSIEDGRSLCVPKNTHAALYAAATAQKDVTPDQLVTNIYLMERIMERIIGNLESYAYFSEFSTVYSDAYRLLCQLPAERRTILETRVPDHHFMIKRAVVTPSRIISLPAVPTANNRLLGIFDSKDIIIVSFKDEDMAKLSEVETFPRVSAVIRNGVEINGTKFYFFCSTASQLRSHKAYFIAARSYNDVLTNRNSIIPNIGDFTSAAKYLSRLGLYGSAGRAILQLPRSEIQKIDDDKASNGELTTDGAGKISLRKAEQIARDMGEDLPSAFQIRYSGVKGIFVCTKNDDPDLQGKDFAFRPSMEKFENKDIDLCILGGSKVFDLYLNREVITLLSSIKSDWPLGSTLLRYQEKELENVAKMFWDTHKARETLKMYLPKYEIERLKECSFEILEERFWFYILQGVYRLQTRLIRTKTSLPVEKGCLLIGVPDPDGVLAENEVFVQIRKEGERPRVLNQPIIMYRNPCLHPGDIRRVNCVQKPSLMHLHNVVVLPAKSCAFSLAAACSGGDLDGDKFAVIWDPELVPAERFMFPACDYKELAKPPNNLPQVNVANQEALARFYTDFMKNDSLGRVAHQHLALCDIQTDGARDSIAIELAKSQALAVDYPKTGIPVTVPKAALQIVKENGFPDFMEKTDSYHSQKILGELYRRCKSVTFDFDVLSKRSDVKILMNMNLFVKGHEEYLPDAVQVYIAYAHHMEMLMTKFQLKVEADVIIGQATYNWSQHLQADKGKASDGIKASYSAIVRKFREIFFENVKTKDDRMEKASAWYRVVNDPEIKIRGMGSSKRFLSFPWVVQEVLCEIQKNRERDQPSRVKIGMAESLLQLFKKNSSMLQKNIADKLKFMKDIEVHVDRLSTKQYKVKNGFVVTTYGSTSIYVCEPESDIDICVVAKPKVYRSKIIPAGREHDFKQLSPVEQHKHFLQHVISRAVDPIVSSKKEILGTSVPIIKCVSGDSDNPISCDISMNEIGLKKTLYILNLYREKAWFFPLFWFLVRWARIVGLIKSIGSSEASVMATAEFYIIIITILECPASETIPIEKPTRHTGIKNLFQCLDRLQLEDLHELGGKLYDFFRIASNLKGNKVLHWPCPEIPAVTLDDSQIKQVARLSKSAFHCLSATRNVETLQTYCSAISDVKREFTKMLPLSLSYTIGQAHTFHASRLTQVSGAVVSIQTMDGKPNLLLKGEGTQMAISILRTEIQSLIHTNKALMLGRVPQKTSRYFMEGSSIMLLQDFSDVDALLCFADSRGPYELIHNSRQRSSVYLKNKDKETEVDELLRNLCKEKEYERLLNHILKQMEKFPSQDENLKGGLEITARFGCYYLVDINTRIPESQTTITIRELQLATEKGRRSRAAWKRTEFHSNYDYGEQESVRKEPSFRMVKLPAAKKSKFGEEKQTFRQQRKNTKKGVAAAFTPGLLKQNTRDDSARKLSLQIFQQVLRECGFQSGRTMSRQPSVWKISLTPSSSFEVCIELDDKLDIISINERPLHWVHGTLISGRKQSFSGHLHNNPDVRILISTGDKVKEGSELYKSVLYERNDKIKLPIEINEDGKPEISSRAPPKMQKIVNTVRNVQILEMYTNGSIDASVAYGDIYFGEKLSLNRPFCELSLYFNPEKLVQSLGGYINNDLLEGVVKEVYDTATHMQLTLEKFIKSGALQK